MTTRQAFQSIIRERRMFAAGSLDYEYRTTAARRLLAMIRAVPAQWVTP